MYKLYMSVLGVYFLPLEWPCKIPEVYKAPRLWRRVYYSEKNGVPAVTQKSAFAQKIHREDQQTLLMVICIAVILKPHVNKQR